jgi:isoamylase
MSGGAAAAVCIESGQPLPLGLSETCDGFNLAVFTRHGTGVTLLLFDGPASPTAVEIPLDAARHRTGDTWHARLVGLPRGAAYALQVDGPFAPEAGHRFDPRHTLLDPYAAAVVVTPNPGGHRCLVPDLRFDWGDDRPPRHAWRDTVIYETHVRGLTVHPSSGVGRPGCFAGVEMISYFQSLGITALELMPVQAAPALATDGRRDPTTGEPLRNYWGYDPVALFAPRAAYAAGGAVAAFDEFRTMVRNLHRAGIEVVLDVVFNHTAAIYYIPAPGGGYADYTGCGNTLNCNHPVVRSLIVDCLRHWVVHGHVWTASASTSPRC